MFYKIFLLYRSGKQKGVHSMYTLCNTNIVFYVSIH